MTLIKAGKIDEAMKEVRFCLDLLPGWINTAIKIVPKLEAAGRTKEADEVLSSVYNHLKKAHAEYPESASYNNMAAWLFAVTRRQLDLALEHALKAVKLVPDKPEYIDTLAEVYFQRGNKKKAIEYINKSIEIDPKRVYYHRQLKRFKTYDSPKKAPPPPDASF